MRNTWLLTLIVCLFAPSCNFEDSRSPLATVNPPRTISNSEPIATTTPPPSVQDIDSAWKDIEKKISDQKYDDAIKALEALLSFSEKKKDPSNGSRALVKLTQVRIGLHGYEKALRLLKEHSWPQDTIAAAVLHLYYAHALRTYYSAYSWEIRSREQHTKKEVDPKTWTTSDIFEDILTSLSWVYEKKEALAKRKTKDFLEFIDVSGYPEEIRGNLRDSASYLIVDFLGETAFWKPEHLNEVYLLPFENFLKANVKSLSSSDFMNPEIHPLEKIISVLSDLEHWHQKNGQKEAAIESYLEQLRRLYPHFKDEQQKLRAHLSERLKTVEDLPWWSMGMYQLAKFSEAEQNSNSLIEARRLAVEGRSKFERSQGAQACKALALRIESPDYELQVMKTDGPGRASILVQHKNFNKISFRAYEVDLERHIKNSKDYSLLPQWNEVKKLTDEKKPVFSWSSELPSTPDFQMHRTFVTPPIKKEAFYIIVASIREDFKGEVGNKLVAIPFLVSDLVLVQRQASNADLEVRAYAGRLGDLDAAGAQIKLYQYDYKKGHHAVETKTVDARGRAIFSKKKAYNDKQFFLLGKSKGRIALQADWIYFNGGEAPGERVSSFIYTDRSIYRPKQKIFWKILDYKGKQGTSDWAVNPGRSVTVTLYDHNREKTDAKTLQMNEFGTGSGEFVIPEGRMLGRWSIESSHGGSNFIRVEEYKRPTFEVKMESPKVTFRLNEKANYQGEARYYFGQPVTGAEVKWSVTRSPQYAYAFLWWNWRYPTYLARIASEKQIIGSGKSKIQKDGTFKIEFIPQADERLKDQKIPITYNFALEATITDEGGESRISSASFRVGFVSVEAQIFSDVNFFVEGENGKLKIKRTNLSSQPAEGKGKYRLYELIEAAKTWLPTEIPMPFEKDNFLTPGDQKRARWETQYDLQSLLDQWSKKVKDPPPEIQITHAKDGEALVDLPKLKEGAYRLEYETQDEHGGVFKASRNILVVSAHSRLKIPLVLLTEKSSYKVGERMRLFVHSGLPDQRLVLERFRGNTRESEEFIFGTNITWTKGNLPVKSIIDYPITEKDRGGLSWMISALRDHQWMSQSQGIQVTWENKNLKLEFSKFRDKIRPGAKEVWSVAVKSQDKKGDPQPFKKAAEVLAYMYDRSLDSFSPHSPPNPFTLFPSLAYTNPYQTSLGVGQQVWSESHLYYSPDSLPLPDRLKYLASYGIGGMGSRGFRHFVGGLGDLEDGRIYKRAGMKEKESVSLKEDRNERDELLQSKVSSNLEWSDKKLSNKPNSPSAPRLDGFAAPGESSIDQVRSNFYETAFFFPQLRTRNDGSVAIEFEVPDSVTSWNVWAHAVTKDLSSGFVSKTTESIKDLMVRPYLPRFLREGDRATIRVVVNNVSKNTMGGNVDFDIFDLETNQILNKNFELNVAKQPFNVKSQDSTSAAFTLRAPKKPGLYGFRVKAKTGELSDGELRPVPVLPSRLQLSQSRFVILKDKAHREMNFPDMNSAGFDSQSLVVTVNSQLFFSLIDSLPYLLDYPYDCTEQILNRFLSAGILSKVYQDFPSIKKASQKLSARATPFEVWNSSDPNRKLLLEETPWLRTARGETRNPIQFVNVLKSELADKEKTKSLSKLKDAQTAIGGFPWWSGGPPSPYITLYILYGLSKAVEFGIDVPKDVVKKGWNYLAIYYRDLVTDIAKGSKCLGCWEFMTFLNYAASNYPNPSWMEDTLRPEERKAILDYTFENWQHHSPYLKGMLALTLQRMARPQDAKLVFDSVMDSSKTTQDEGTFWVPEDRSWLWYNDTIESHAFAIKVLSELSPSDPRRDGLVQWLFLNKKLNHWKSTRATAEAIYSVVHYLKKENLLATPENMRLKIGSHEVKYSFDPESYSGKNRQTVIEGKQIEPSTMSTVVAEKDTKGLAFVSSTWHFSTESIPKEAKGDLFSVQKRYFKRVLKGSEYTLKLLEDKSEIAVGEELEVQLSIRSKHEAEYVHLRDPRPAGFEPQSVTSGYKWDLGLPYYNEVRDSATNFFFESLPVGEYTLKYRLRATTAGIFRLAPATLQSMYAPEFVAYSQAALSSGEIQIRSAN